MKRLHIRPIIAFVSLFLLTQVKAEEAAAHDAPPPPEAVTVSGEGIVRVAPDKATVSLNVQAQDRELAKAKQKADRKLTAAMGILRDLGVEKKWIRTQSFSIQPQYSYNNGRQYLEEYHVSAYLSIALQAPEKAGLLIEKMVGAEIDQVGGVEYGLKEEDALKMQALEKAVAQARAKAEMLAKTAGATLGRVININESGVSYQPPMPYAAAFRGKMAMAVAESAVDNAAPSPPAGDTEIRAHVQATFLLER